MKRKRDPTQIDKNPVPQKKRKVEVIDLCSDSDEETSIVSGNILRDTLNLSAGYVPPPPHPPQIIDDEDIIIDETPTPQIGFVDENVFSGSQSNEMVPPPTSKPRKRTSKPRKRRRAKSSRNDSPPTPEENKNEAIPVIRGGNPPKSKIRDFKSRNNGKYCKEEIVIYVDREVVKGSGQKKIIDNLKNEFPTVIIVDDNSIRSSLYFGRRLPTDYMEASQEDFEDSQTDRSDGNFQIVPVHDYIVIRMPAEIFVELMLTENGLNNYLNEVERLTKENDTMIILVLCHLTGYLDTQKNKVHRRIRQRIENKENKENNAKKKRKGTKKKKSKQFLYVNPEDAERTILRIEQERKRVKVIVTKSVDETARFLPMIVNRISRLFYERPRNMNLFSRFKETIGKKARNPEMAFIGMLCEIPGISINIAKAVSQAYANNPRSLVDKYRSDHYNENEKELRLADIKAKKTNKRIGNAASRKIYKVFSERDGNKRFRE